jgi:hypothetical protein
LPRWAGIRAPAADRWPARSGLTPAPSPALFAPPIDVGEHERHPRPFPIDGRPANRRRQGSPLSGDPIASS